MVCRVAICDDSAADAAFVGGLAADWAAARGVQLHTRTFPSAESFLFAWEEDARWDILLLDIEMGGMDGVAMARTLRKQDKAVQIVFVTGYAEYIAEGYEVAALHYLMKPVDGPKLHAVLDRALEKLQQNSRCLALEAAGQLLRIPLYEIRYLDVQANYVTVHAGQCYTVKRPLADVEKELDSRFVRVGRSLILNLKYISRVTRQQVLLADGTALPLPRSAYEPLNRAIISQE